MHPSSHKFLTISDKIRRHIESLPSGSPIPSTTYWREKLRASRSTITKAFSELKREGVIRTKVGSGSVRGQMARIKTVLILWDSTNANLHNMPGAEFLTGASQFAATRPDLLVSHLDSRTLTPDWAPRHLIPQLSSVIFFRSELLSQKLGPAVEKAGIPWLLYGSSIYAKGPHSLGVNEDQVAALALDLLQKEGHQSIGMVYRQNHPAGEARFEAWKNWHWKHQKALVPNLAWQHGADYPTRPAGHSFLSREKDFRSWLGRLTAVFCATDSEAFDLIESARRIGKRVPDDFSVIGVNNDRLGERLIPGLTTVDIPIFQHGISALKKILSGNLEGELLNDASLVTRGTVAKSKKTST